MVNIKLAYMNWYFDNLVILIMRCNTPHKNLDKALLFLRNQAFCLKNWAPTTIEFVEILHALPTYQCVQKGIRGSLVFFISFCLDLELFAKIKGPGFYTLTDTRFFNNSGSKQNKKGKQESCSKFQQKILNSVVVGARQNFP